MYWIIELCELWLCFSILRCFLLVLFEKLKSLKKNIVSFQCPGVLQWLQWSESSLLPNVLGYVLPSVSAAALDGAVVAAYKAELYAQLALLDKYLVSRTYLAGERLSLADISVALNLLPAFQVIIFIPLSLILKYYFSMSSTEPSARQT